MKDPVQDDILDQIRWLGERARTWQIARDQVLPLAQQMQALGAEVTFSWSLYVTASGNGKLLTQLVRVLRRAGYQSYSARPKANSSTWSGGFNKEQPPGMDDDEFGKKWPTIVISFTSSVCKQVQTGTETKEVPVFETVCDSIEINEELKDTETEAV